MIEGSIKKTGVGAKIAEETSVALEEIVTGATKVTDLIGEIASASKEQANGIAQINQGLAQVDQVTQQVTANAEESASASQELSGQSLQLKQMLTRFRLKKQGFEHAGLRPAPRNNSGDAADAQEYAADAAFGPGQRDDRRNALADQDIHGQNRQEGASNCKTVRCHRS